MNSTISNCFVQTLQGSHFNDCFKNLREQKLTFYNLSYRINSQFNTKVV